MKSSNDKEKAIDEIVKIIEDFQYNDELSDINKIEISDQNKIYDWQSIYNKGQLAPYFCEEFFKTNSNNATSWIYIN